jgi:putative transposase
VRRSSPLAASQNIFLHTFLTPFSYTVLPGQHFLTLVRYVERNAQRAGLVRKAEDWPWSSVYARLYGNEKQKQLLSPWPVAEPKDYVPWLNHPPTERGN